MTAFLHGQWHFLASLAGSPLAGRGEVLINARPMDQVNSSTLDADLAPATNQPLVWVTINLPWVPTKPAGPRQFVSSYSMSGGRALSGNFHFLDEQLRVWRREVVGTMAASNLCRLVSWWNARWGVQFGILSYTEKGTRRFTEGHGKAEENKGGFVSKLDLNDR